MRIRRVYGRRVDPHGANPPRLDPQREDHRLAFQEILSPCELQLQDAIAEWRTRQESRRVGVGLCTCHVPGSQAITPRAQTREASGYDVMAHRTIGMVS